MACFTALCGATGGWGGDADVAWQHGGSATLDFGVGSACGGGCAGAVGVAGSRVGGVDERGVSGEVTKARGGGGMRWTGICCQEGHAFRDRFFAGC